MAAEAPTGTVTFLFTDIEGSTRLWEEHGEAMAAALARHDEIARSVFDAHDGYVFATGGDGFAVAFGRGADAMEAAAAAQAALSSEPWDGAVIKVRMGLHTGEAEERGGDYFGPAVNRAARVMAVGNGGQILATEACAQVVDSNAVVELGEFRLRDLSGPQRVFQIGEASFPALRTLDAYPSNLPRSLSTLIGRGPQVAQVLEDLRVGDLVTLTGTGGVGKTRLALQVCAEGLPTFPSGAWFVDLASIRDPDEVVTSVATVLDVKERAGETLGTTLRDYLRDREAIILLDNGEHVVDALADLIELLRSRDTAAKFLITSREPLGIDGEQVRRVVSLDSEESADLFVLRASSVRNEVDWASYSSEVDEICERLDGIPLAIELAAARSRSMLPPDILRRLNERFRLLSGGRRTARERHQTLLAAVEWSYELLDDAEAALFDRLAVFRGGFSLEAAEAVCSGGAVDELDVLDLLDRLVDKSMVLAYESGDRSRDRLLETLRQFGESRLVDSGEADLYRDRHVDYFVEMATERSSRLGTNEQRHVIEELAAERANLDATADWLADNDRWLELSQFCGQLKTSWAMGGRPEGLRWYGVMVEHLDRLELEDQATVLADAAFTIASGEARASGDLAERSVAAAAEAGSSPSPFAYVAMAVFGMKNGDEEEAARFARRAQEVLPDRYTLPYPAPLAIQVTAAIELRRADAPAEVAELAAYAEETGIPMMATAARFAEGRLASLSGEFGLGDQILTDAIDGARGISPATLISATAHRAEGRLRVGDDRVVEGISEALDVFADTPATPDSVADIWAMVATVWLREGRVEDAAVLGCAAGALLMSLGVRGSANRADIREQLGDDLAAMLTPEELDAHIVAAWEMTADELRRFILERL